MLLLLFYCYSGHYYYYLYVYKESTMIPLHRDTDTAGLAMSPPSHQARTSRPAPKKLGGTPIAGWFFLMKKLNKKWMTTGGPRTWETSWRSQLSVLLTFCWLRGTVIRLLFTKSCRGPNGTQGEWSCSLCWWRDKADQWECSKYSICQYISNIVYICILLLYYYYYINMWSSSIAASVGLSPVKTLAPPQHFPQRFSAKKFCAESAVWWDLATRLADTNSAVLPSNLYDASNVSNASNVSWISYWNLFKFIE